MNGRSSNGQSGLGATTAPYRWDRRDSAVSGPADRSHHPASSIPAFPPYGLNTHQLSDAQKDFTEYARRRIEGIGAAQYSNGNVQAFEDMPLQQLLDEALQEAADLVNYATFIAIRLKRLAAVVAVAEASV